VEWPAKRSYAGLVAVGVQEQAEDILVPPLLRNCLTFNYIPLSYHYLPPQNSGPCNSFYCLGHFKNVYDDDDDDERLTPQPGQPVLLTVEGLVENRMAQCQ